MAYVTVRQLNNKDYRDMSCIYDEAERLQKAKEVLKNNDYLRVADLVIGGKLQEVLNEAYTRTNSLDSAWYEDPEIQVSESAQNGCRSTSIGDIIQINGDSYMVASVGFKFIDTAA